MSDKIRAYKGQYGTLEVEKLHMGKYVSFMIEDAGRKVLMNLPPKKVKSLAGFLFEDVDSKEIPTGINANVSVDELESIMEGVREVEAKNARLEEDYAQLKTAWGEGKDENARLRAQNANLAGAAGELRQYIIDERSKYTFIENSGIKILDYKGTCHECIYSDKAAATGYCDQEDATGHPDCPAKLRRCPHCNGSGVEG